KSQQQSRARRRLSRRVYTRLDRSLHSTQIELLHVIPEQPRRMIRTDQTVQVHRSQLDLIANRLAHPRLACSIAPACNTSFRQIFKKSRAHSSLQKRIAARRNHAAPSSAIRSRSGFAERFTSSSDEIAQLASDLWPSCPLPRFPAPERRETNTMPAKDGLRLNDMRRTEQAWPESGQPHHQGPVTAAQSKARRRTPQGDAELMAKEQVLDFKSPRRLEEVYNEHYERMQEREHRPRSCADSTRPCDSQAGWNFRKAQAQRGDGRHASGDRPRQGAWPHRAVFARAPVAAYR